MRVVRLGLGRAHIPVNAGSIPVPATKLSSWQCQL